MEVLLGGAVIGLGYLFTKNGINRQTPSFTDKISKNNKPNGDNIIESRRSYNIWENEQKRAQNLFKKTVNPVKSNVIISGPPFNKVKVDYSDKQLPIEFNADKNYEKTYLNLNESTNIGPQLQDNLTLNSAEPPTSGGWATINSGGPTSPDLLWNLDEVMEVIGGGFEIIHAAVESTILDESDLHRGKANVVRIHLVKLN